MVFLESLELFVASAFIVDPGSHMGSHTRLAPKDDSRPT